MSREIRKVPEDWNIDKHKKNYYGNHSWMFSMSDYEYFLKDYEEDMIAFKKDPDEYDNIEPEKPLKEELIPLWDYFQLFQTISEWTPISPTFKTIEELIEHISTKWDDYWDIWTKESTQMLLDDCIAFSAIIDNWIIKKQSQI